MGSYKRTVALLTELSLISAASIVLHYVESFLPPIIVGLPVKLGLANIFTVYTLVQFSRRDALLVTLIRCVLGSLLGGSVSGIMYSVCGGVLSWGIMSLLLVLYKRQMLTEIGLSAAGAWFFNLGQLVVGVVLNGPAMLLYFPVMQILSIPSGLIVGVLSIQFMKFGNKRHLYRDYK